MSTTDTAILVNNESNSSGTPRTQHSLSRREIVHGIANRIIYSRFYVWLYGGMIILSIFSVVLSLTDKCQTVSFLILEIIINAAMIAEVITRFLALGKLFWKSIFNIIDILLVALCIATLLLLIDNRCSYKGEEVFDLILLGLRNAIQIGRILVIIRKGSKHAEARKARVDFNNVRAPSVSMDIDPNGHGTFLLDDEEDDFI